MQYCTQQAKTSSQVKTKINMSDKVFKSKKIKQANKSSKPLLERQRRARINNSLNELKHLVLSSLYQGCPQAEKNGEKMEKAEILELTVNFLKLAKSRRHYGLRAVELNQGKFNPSSQDYFARVENTMPRCSEQVLASHVQPVISPNCSIARTTTTVDSGVCCTVQPCLGYQMSSSYSPVSQLSAPSLSTGKMSARYQQPTPTASFLHARPSSKVQVWRPW